jgi:hypothetical protein
MGKIISIYNSGLRFVMVAVCYHKAAGNSFKRYENSSCLVNALRPNDDFFRMAYAKSSLLLYFLYITLLSKNLCLFSFYSLSF